MYEVVFEMDFSQIGESLEIVDFVDEVIVEDETTELLVFPEGGDLFDVFVG